MKITFKNRYGTEIRPGSPFIQTGDNLKYYFDTNQNMFVNDLKYNGNQIVFIVDEINKTNYKNPTNQK